MRRKQIMYMCAIGAAAVMGLTACGGAQDAGQTPAETVTRADGQTETDGQQEAGSGAEGASGEAATDEENKDTDDGAQEAPADLDFTVDLEGITTAKLSAGVSVHDPSIFKADGKYYIFGSHMSTAVSEDLSSWTPIGTGYKVKDPIYYELMGNEEAFAYAGSKKSLIPTDDRGWHVWAPDVIYNEATGLYYLYFCTTSTWNASNLCYATSENVEGPYEWKGALIYSGFTAETLDATDVVDYVEREEAKDRYIKKSNEYNFNKYPNAIDPTVLYDQDGRLWMVYGSWSGGMYLLELDAQTGEVIHPEADEEKRVDPYFGKRLLGGNHSSIEAPYILYDEESGYYYLFVSYGGLAREGGYQIRVFRSETIDGDYVDMNGEFPLDTENPQHYPFGLKMSGNYNLPSLEVAYMATGHNSAFIDEDGKKYIVNHTRFDNKTEEHEPRVHQFIVNEEGWPCMLPYATAGETVSGSGYEMADMAGRYYVINQGTAIDAEIAQPFILYLQEDGSVYGDGITGSWEAEEGTCYMSITYDGTAYSGVFCQMNDEAGTQVMTFSAVGANESVWGVKY